MARIAKNVIGEFVTSKRGTTWKVVKEFDRADEKPATRKFEVECQKCQSKKQCTYNNLFISKNLLCNNCLPIKQPKEKKAYVRKAKKEVEIWEPKLMKNGEVDKRYIRGNTVEFVGKIFECVYDTFLVVEELPRVLSKNRKNVYRNFRVQCQKCGTERETLAASLNAKGVACPECRKQTRGVKLDLSLPPIGIERKIEIIHEINEIWDEMKRLQRMGQLTKYLVDKFNINDWLINDDEETEHIETTNTTDYIDDIDYGDDSIDWDGEINKYK